MNIAINTLIDWIDSELKDLQKEANNLDKEVGEKMLALSSSPETIKDLRRRSDIIRGKNEELSNLASFLGQFI